MKLLSTLLVVILLSCTGQPHFETEREVLPPYGYTLLLERGLDEKIIETPSVYNIDILKQVSREIGMNFTYTLDSINYKETDYWVLPDYKKPFNGDCEDYALAVRHELREYGIPSRLIIGKSGDMWHAGVAVGPYVIENNYQKPLVYFSKEYKEGLNIKWVIISGYELNDPWYQLK